MKISFEMEVEVHDLGAFLRAARERALKENAVTSMRQAKREYNRNNLTACAIMLFDPGISPPGCQIEGSAAQEIEL